MLYYIFYYCVKDYIIGKEIFYYMFLLDFKIWGFREFKKGICIWR